MSVLVNISLYPLLPDFSSCFLYLASLFSFNIVLTILLLLFLVCSFFSPPMPLWSQQPLYFRHHFGFLPFPHKQIHQVVSYQFGRNHMTWRKTIIINFIYVLIDMQHTLHIAWSCTWTTFFFLSFSHTYFFCRSRNWIHMWHWEKRKFIHIVFCWQANRIDSLNAIWYRSLWRS